MAEAEVRPHTVHSYNTSKWVLRINTQIKFYFNFNFSFAGYGFTIIQEFKDIVKGRQIQSTRNGMISYSLKIVIIYM